VGLDLEQFAQCDLYRGQLRTELGIAETQRLVGIVGRLVPIKNHHLFLQAAAIVGDALSDVSFVIVGDGALRDGLENYARQLGIAHRVVFTGWRKDQARIYADLDILTLSSNNEGTPASLIEGMASGCPVVATNVGGVPDLIQHGENGWLVDAGDAAGLARGILQALQQPELAKRAAARARSQVLEIHSKKRLLDEIESLYSGLLNRRNICRIPLPQVPGSREEANCGSSS
jgi:glycosyltransferase involved in cell wall biosynthesis